jgi:hypothetical protein
MKIEQAAVGTMLALVGSVAGAGKYQPFPLSIDLVTKLANGDMYSTRLSGNPDGFIGCGVRAPAPGFAFGFCQASLGPADEDVVQCFTEGPVKIAAIAAQDDFSFVTFRWDDNGNCTSVGNSAQSSADRGLRGARSFITHPPTGAAGRGMPLGDGGLSGCAARFPSSASAPRRSRVRPSRHRPAMALSASGPVRYTLQTPYRDGIKHIVLEPDEASNGLRTIRDCESVD